MIPPPGHPDAADQGCTCPTMDNRRGRGYYAAKDGVYSYSMDCELHADRHAGFDEYNAWKASEQSGSIAT